MGTARPLYKSFLSILQEELVPALGCTEPIAIAYAAAVAAHRAGGPPRSILAECSGNIIKSVKSVTVPNSGGMRGPAAGGLTDRLPPADCPGAGYGGGRGLPGLIGPGSAGPVPVSDPNL